MEQYKRLEDRRPMERVLYEVKKIIVGQDHLLGSSEKIMIPKIRE